MRCCSWQLTKIAEEEWHCLWILLWAVFLNVSVFCLAAFNNLQIMSESLQCLSWTAKSLILKWFNVYWKFWSVLQLGILYFLIWNQAGIISELIQFFDWTAKSLNLTFSWCVLQIDVKWCSLICLQIFIGLQSLQIFVWEMFTKELTTIWFPPCGRSMAAILPVMPTRTIVWSLPNDKLVRCCMC